ARQAELRQADQAEDVGLELAADLRHRDLLEDALLSVARVVDEGADGTLRALDGLDRGAHRALVADVQRQRLAALQRQPLNRLRLPRRRVDRVSLAREMLGSRAADSRRAPGDEHCLR